MGVFASFPSQKFARYTINGQSTGLISVPPQFHYFLLWRLAGWGLVSIVLYLSLVPGPPKALDFAFSDKFEHFFAYSLLMGWFGQLYVLRLRQIFIAVALCLMGITVEFAQGWGGHRFFDMADMVANSLGVLLGWWLSNRWLAGSLLRIDHVLSRWLG